MFYASMKTTTRKRKRWKERRKKKLKRKTTANVTSQIPTFKTNLKSTNTILSMSCRIVHFMVPAYRRWCSHLPWAHYFVIWFPIFVREILLLEDKMIRLIPELKSTKEKMPEHSAWWHPVAMWSDDNFLSSLNMVDNDYIFYCTVVSLH